MELYPSLLARLARLLEGAGIPYMVIGGQAVLLHGEPRLTRDIDVTMGCEADQLGRSLDLTAKEGLRPAVTQVKDFVRRTNVLPVADNSTGIRVDLIFLFTPYEAEAISRSTVVHLEDTDVHFAAVEDLIIHKLVAGRPRDLEDVRGVLLHNPSLNESYLLKWLPTFDGVVERELVSEYRRLKGSLSRPGS